MIGSRGAATVVFIRLIFRTTLALFSRQVEVGIRSRTRCALGPIEERVLGYTFEEVLVLSHLLEDALLELLLGEGAVDPVVAGQVVPDEELLIVVEGDG